MGPTLPTIFANCATCSWETLTMLNPQFVAGEHGLFGGHESEDIRTISSSLSTLTTTYLKLNPLNIPSQLKTHFLSI